MRIRQFPPATVLSRANGISGVSSMLFSLHKLSGRDALKAGVLLSSRLSLIVAAASIGVEEGLITSEIKDSIVLLALLSCLLAPTIFKLLQRRETDKVALLQRHS